MTDMPEFRRWADAAHRDSLRKRKASKPLYKCTICTHRTTRNQAKRNGGYCFHCKSPLRAHQEFQR